MIWFISVQLRHANIALSLRNPDYSVIDATSKIYFCWIGSLSALHNDNTLHRWRQSTGYSVSIQQSRGNAPSASLAACHVLLACGCLKGIHWYPACCTADYMVSLEQSCIAPWFAASREKINKWFIENPNPLLSIPNWAGNIWLWLFIRHTPNRYTPHPPTLHVRLRGRQLGLVKYCWLHNP